MYKPVENYNVFASAILKRNVDIPVIVGGGIRKKQDAIDIITQGKADCVTMCRPFIIEPDLIKKFIEGIQNTSRCLSCNHCLFGLASHSLKCYYGKIKIIEKKI